MQRRHDRGEHVRDRMSRYPRYDFWRNNPYWARWRYARPYRWATYAGIVGWFGWSSGTGYYYDYGSNIYYDEGQVYYGDQAVATADAYAQQATDIAAAGAEAIDEAVTQDREIEWMPLGVFVLTEEEDDADPTMYLQLTVSKDAVISGTYHNSLTGQSLPVQGSVDKQTQRAAWTIGENHSTVMETGVYNLTQDETPILIHFGDEVTQQRLLVRLEEPDAQGQ